ncbi:hypothetical protein DL768_007233 [Monosporascus sp. mg162]|nr:hypothetical protein DL768_007233 [Monosporascus sp. mg162]
MKTIGLLGGMSWESTTTYYKEINRRVRQVQCGLHSARCVVFSFDFAEIEELQLDHNTSNQLQSIECFFANYDAAAKLRLAGAEAVVFCTNTMHFVSHGIERASQLPLIHIVDPTAEHVLKERCYSGYIDFSKRAMTHLSITAAGFKSVGLLGTGFTMEKDFYRSRLADKFGLRVIVPDEEGRATVHSIIYTELANGIISET